MVGCRELVIGAKMMITIVYDNELYDKRLKSGWGFSCLIEHLDKKILFDVGDDAGKLSFNLNALKINPEDIDALVLSHNHWDHTGGLEAVIGGNNRVELFFGNSYPEDFKTGLKKRGIKFSPVSEITNVSQGVHTGPEMGSFGPAEIPLTVETKSGLVVITGCAHPGIAKMVRKVKEAFAKEIYLVLGGFHLGKVLSLGKIISELKEMGIKKAAPCHCTGERAIKLFQEGFKENFIKVGAGLKIKLDK